MQRFFSRNLRAAANNSGSATAQLKQAAAFMSNVTNVQLPDLSYDYAELEPVISGQVKPPSHTWFFPFHNKTWTNPVTTTTITPHQNKKGGEAWQRTDPAAHTLPHLLQLRKREKRRSDVADYGNPPLKTSSNVREQFQRRRWEVCGCYWVRGCLWSDCSALSFEVQWYEVHALSSFISQYTERHSEARSSHEAMGVTSIAASFLLLVCGTL